MTAAIPAAEVATSGTAAVTVFNPGQGGGSSNAVSVAINYPVSLYYFAQMVIGGGWQSTLTYVNYTRDSANCQTSFSDTSGAPLTVPFGGKPASSSRTDRIAAGGVLHQESTVDPTAPVVTGWALARCDGPIKANLLYRSYQAGKPTAEASVSGTLPATKFVSFANNLTGVACANPSTQTALMTFTAFDSSGTKVGTTNLTLPPGSQRSAFIGQLLNLSGFVGSIQVTSTSPDRRGFAEL